MRRRAWLALALLFVTGAAAGPAASPTPAEAWGSSVFVAKVYYTKIKELDALRDYDLWEFNNLDEQYVLVALDQKGYETLRRQGWRVAVDAAATEQLRAAQARRHFDEGYRRVEALYADLHARNAAHPTLTELVPYGASACRRAGGCVTPGGEALDGFELLALRVTNEAVPGASQIDGRSVVRGQKPVFILIAAIHAREITTPEIAMRLLDWLLDGYGVDADATWLVDWHETWIVPVANPDGHWLVALGQVPPYGGAPFYQRKNANQDADGDGRADCAQWPPTPYVQFGVDLNRNHSFAWGGAGASLQPCAQAYRGPTPASEPETAQLQALVAALIPDQRGPGPNDPAPPETTGILISLHSFSELVLWPWGHSLTPAPNADGLRAIGARLAAFNGYLACQAGPCLYQASGTTDDWAYGELGIPAFTFELGTEFMPPYAAIDADQWPRNGPALQYAARIARAPYLTVQGPEVTDLATAVTPDGQLRLTAVLDDRDGDAVIAAAYTLNTPFWADGADPQPLTPLDGAFDSAVEGVTAVFDVSALGPGPHILFVHGQAAGGYWGPVSAIFIGRSQTFREKTHLPVVMR